MVCYEVVEWGVGFFVGLVLVGVVVFGFGNVWYFVGFVYFVLLVFMFFFGVRYGCEVERLFCECFVVVFIDGFVFEGVVLLELL